ncbi:F-box protein At2g15640-like [Capsella rubella]|uniref:F-box protein At2g15640-like n=1 Tax=Capsella rubella TaxID=81985 RepID=UPI000CD4A1CE|nr:F-box protein At2g15640-like [Capsella rubella]
MISSSPIWRLTSKSLARLPCVSKLWSSMFMTKSTAKPRLLFAIEENDCGVWSFFSSPQLDSPYENTSSTTLVAAAKFHVRFSPARLLISHHYDLMFFSCGYDSGLLHMYGSRYQARPMICNPITGRYAILPERYTYRKAYSFFGFDPIEKQYKVLSMAYPFGPGRHKILTFGNGDMGWRKIKCPLKHEVSSDGVRINGVLYYLGDSSNCTDGNAEMYYHVIVCLDLRSEEFTFIGIDMFCKLINYKGKLALIYWEDDPFIYKFSSGTTDSNELHLWVLEDVEKQEWSKHTYTNLRYDDSFRREVSIAGVTALGEIVFSMREYIPEEPFYVFYFNPERNTLQRVEIQGFGEATKEYCRVRTFVNHVEDFNDNQLEQLKSVHPPLKDSEYVEPSDSESD